MNECEIFMAALERESVLDRNAFLDEACGGNTQLRQRIESLLDSHGKAESLLEHPAFDVRNTVSLGRSEFSTDGRVTTDDPGPAPLEPIALDFLDPAEVPESLGRLGAYNIAEIIGRGGMGVVLKAHDPKLNRVVAIKVLAPELAASPTARKRFLREAQAAAAVVHQHVVTIHAVNEDRVPYLVMECVSGQSLQEKLDREGHLELKEILRIGMQVASGLAAAHAQGVTHRDVKPGNILLENSVDRVKITDFGLARVANDVAITRTGEVAGTPQYMSPEQAQGQSVDYRSDLFSLGSVLYAMCTGRSPFRAESIVAALRRVCDEMPRPIREINPEIPVGLADTINRLLAKNAADRFQKAAEVVDLLRKHLANLQSPDAPVVPESVVLADKHGPHSKERRTEWMIAVTLLLVFAAGLGLAEATGTTRLVATVVRILTPDGTLVIETDDPGVKVTIEGDGGIVITGAGPQKVRLRPGSYRVLATKDGKPVRAEELVTISRGGRRVVTITHEVPPVTNASKPIAPKHVLKGHGSWIHALTFSPHGKTLATGSNDQTVRLWDSATGSLKHVFHAEEGLITCLAYSPDGALLVSGSNLWKVRVWDAATFKLLAEVQHNEVVRTVAFRSSDSMLATASDDATVKLWKWDGKDLALIRTLGKHSAGVHAMSFNPQGTMIASVTFDGMLNLWDVESGESLKSARIGSQALSCVAYSPDGTMIAVGGFIDKQVYLCNADTLESVGTLRGHKESVRSLLFLDDGKTLVSAGANRVFQPERPNPKGELKLWDVAGLKERLSVDGYEAGVMCLALSPDGKTLATGDLANEGRLWEVDTHLAGDPAGQSSSTGPAVDRRLEEAAREFDQALSRVGVQHPYGLERQRIVKQFLASDELFHRVAELRPQDTSLWGVRAYLFAEAGSWKEAAASYKKRLELGTDGAGLWCCYAVTLLAANDVDGYRNVCEEMLGLFANVSDPQEAWFVAWTTAIVPDSVEDKQQALRIAERTRNGLENTPWRSWAYATWLYRLGRLEESIASFEEAAAKEDWDEARLCFLAMAHHRLGNADQARQYADQASSKEAEWSKLTPWTRGPISQQLLKEMNAVLAKPPDAKAEVNDPKSGTHPSEDAPKPAADHGDSDSADSDKPNNAIDD